MSGSFFDQIITNMENERFINAVTTTKEPKLDLLSVSSTQVKERAQVFMRHKSFGIKNALNFGMTLNWCLLRYLSALQIRPTASSFQPTPTATARHKRPVRYYFAPEVLINQDGLIVDRASAPKTFLTQISLDTTTDRTMAHVHAVNSLAGITGGQNPTTNQDKDNEYSVYQHFVALKERQKKIDKEIEAFEEDYNKGDLQSQHVRALLYERYATITQLTQQAITVPTEKSLGVYVPCPDGTTCAVPLSNPDGSLNQAAARVFAQSGETSPSTATMTKALWQEYYKQMEAGNLPRDIVEAYQAQNKLEADKKAWKKIQEKRMRLWEDSVEDELAAEFENWQYEQTLTPEQLAAHRAAQEKQREDKFAFSTQFHPDMYSTDPEKVKRRERNLSQEKKLLEITPEDPEYADVHPPPDDCPTDNRGELEMKKHARLVHDNHEKQKNMPLWERCHVPVLSYKKIGRLLLRVAQYQNQAPQDRYHFAVNLWNELFTILYTYQDQIKIICGRIMRFRHFHAQHHTYYSRRLKDRLQRIYFFEERLSSEQRQMLSPATDHKNVQQTLEDKSRPGASPQPEELHHFPDTADPTPDHEKFSNWMYDHQSYHIYYRYWQAHQELDKKYGVSPLFTPNSSKSPEVRRKIGPAPGEEDPRAGRELNAEQAQYLAFRGCVLQQDSYSRPFPKDPKEHKHIVAVDPTLLYLSYLLCDGVLGHIHRTIASGVLIYDAIDKSRIMGELIDGADSAADHYDDLPSVASKTPSANHFNHIQPQELLVKARARYIIPIEPFHAFYKEKRKAEILQVQTDRTFVEMKNNTERSVLPGLMAPDCQTVNQMNSRLGKPHDNNNNNNNNNNGDEESQGPLATLDEEELDDESASRDSCSHSVSSGQHSLSNKIAGGGNLPGLRNKPALKKSRSPRADHYTIFSGLGYIYSHGPPHPETFYKPLQRIIFEPTLFDCLSKSPILLPLLEPVLLGEKSAATSTEGPRRNDTPASGILPLVDSKKYDVRHFDQAASVAASMLASTTTSNFPRPREERISPPPLDKDPLTGADVIPIIPNTHSNSSNTSAHTTSQSTFGGNTTVTVGGGGGSTTTTTAAAGGGGGGGSTALSSRPDSTNPAFLPTNWDDLDRQAQFDKHQDKHALMYQDFPAYLATLPPQERRMLAMKFWTMQRGDVPVCIEQLGLPIYRPQDLRRWEPLFEGKPFLPFCDEDGDEPYIPHQTIQGETPVFPTDVPFIYSQYYTLWVRLQELLMKNYHLSNFQFFRILGRGAFGTVSGVQHDEMNTIYAMKEIQKRMIKQSNERGYESMVLNERRILKAMNSPFVLCLQAALHDTEKLYLLTDICLGGDLSFHLKQSPQRCFSYRRARFYAAQVVLGLEHMHSRNVIYRDLKPSNILLDAEGNAKISDLGLAHRMQKGDKILRHVAGTAGYWAPEILSKRGTFCTSDYWSLGVFLYEMLTGHRPRTKSEIYAKYGKLVLKEKQRVKEKEGGILNTGRLMSLLHRGATPAATAQVEKEQEKKNNTNQAEGKSQKLDNTTTNNHDHASTTRNKNIPPGADGPNNKLNSPTMGSKKHSAPHGEDGDDHDEEYDDGDDQDYDSRMNEQRRHRQRENGDDDDHHHHHDQGDDEDDYDHHHDGDDDDGDDCEREEGQFGVHDDPDEPGPLNTQHGQDDADGGRTSFSLRQSMNISRIGRPSRRGGGADQEDQEAVAATIQSDLPADIATLVEHGLIPADRYVLGPDGKTWRKREEDVFPLNPNNPNGKRVDPAHDKHNPAECFPESFLYYKHANRNNRRAAELPTDTTGTTRFKIVMRGATVQKNAPHLPTSAPSTPTQTREFNFKQPTQSQSQSQSQHQSSQQRPEPIDPFAPVKAKKEVPNELQTPRSRGRNRSESHSRVSFSKSRGGTATAGPAASGSSTSDRPRGLLREHKPQPQPSHQPNTPHGAHHQDYEGTEDLQNHRARTQGRKDVGENKSVRARHNARGVAANARDPYNDPRNPADPDELSEDPENPHYHHRQHQADTSLHAKQEHGGEEESGGELNKNYALKHNIGGAPSDPFTQVDVLKKVDDDLDGDNAERNLERDMMQDEYVGTDRALQHRAANEVLATKRAGDVDKLVTYKDHGVPTTSQFVLDAEKSCQDDEAKRRAKLEARKQQQQDGTHPSNNDIYDDHSTSLTHTSSRPTHSLPAGEDLVGQQRKTDDELAQDTLKKLQEDEMYEASRVARQSEVYRDALEHNHHMFPTNKNVQPLEKLKTTMTEGELEELKRREKDKEKDRIVYRQKQRERERERDNNKTSHEKERDARERKQREMRRELERQRELEAQHAMLANRRVVYSETTRGLPIPVNIMDPVKRRCVWYDETMYGALAVPFLYKEPFLMLPDTTVVRVSEDNLVTVNDIQRSIDFVSNEKRWTPFDQDERFEVIAREEGSLLDVEVDFNIDSHLLTPQAVDFLMRLFDPNPHTRLGAQSIEEIKQHPFFTEALEGLPPLDWEALRKGLIIPPYKPDENTVHAKTMDELQQPTDQKWKNTPLRPGEDKIFDKWYWTDQVHRENALVKGLNHIDNIDVHLWGQRREDKKQKQSGCCEMM